MRIVWAMLAVLLVVAAGSASAQESPIETELAAINAELKQTIAEQEAISLEVEAASEMIELLRASSAAEDLFFRVNLLSRLVELRERVFALRDRLLVLRQRSMELLRKQESPEQEKELEPTIKRAATQAVLYLFNIFFTALITPSFPMP